MSKNQKNRRRNGQFEPSGQKRMPQQQPSSSSSSSFITQELDYETLDLFQVMTAAAIEGHFTIEQIIELCYTYGVEHGKMVNRNIARTTAQQRYHPSQLVLDFDENTNSSHTTLEELSSNGEASSQGYGSGHQMGKRSAKRTKSDMTGFEGPSLFTQAQKGSTLLQSPSSQQFKGVSPMFEERTRSSSSSDSRVQRYLVFLEIFEKKVIIGEYPDPIEAAQAHDRALIRALGPCACKEDELNFNIRRYSKDPIDSFSMFDATLRDQLFGTSWKGVEDCDFSFLILSFPTFNDFKKMRTSKMNHSVISLK